MRSIFLTKKRQDIVFMLDDDSDLERQQLLEQNKGYSQIKLIQELQKNLVNWNSVADVYRRAFSNLDSLVAQQTFLTIVQKKNKIQMEVYIHCLLRFSTNDNILDFIDYYLQILEEAISTRDDQILVRILKILFNLFIDISFIDINSRNKLIEIHNTYFDKNINSQNIKVIKLLAEIQIILVKSSIICTQQILLLFNQIHPESNILAYKIFLLNELIILKFIDKNSNYSQILHDTLQFGFQRLLLQQIDLKLIEALTLTMISSVQFLNCSFYDKIQCLFQLSIKNLAVNKLFFEFLLVQVKDEPITKIMKNIDIQIVNYLVSQFNTPISELCLDVFLELQDSFEPQFLWFQAVVYADIKTENGADAISIILASFLEADEIFWGVLIESFDMICEKLSRFDRSKLVMEFLEDCQVGICQRDEF